MSDAVIIIILAPVIFLLFIALLILGLKNRIKVLIKNEIFNDFPTLKNIIADFERKIDYLKAQVDSLEARITELGNKTNKE